MKILPDDDFRDKYKQCYDENYKKLTKKFNDASARRKELKSQNHIYSLKDVVIGGCLFTVIFGIFIALGSFMYTMFAEKECKISDLTSEIQMINADIGKYQQRDANILKTETDELITAVIDLQNQYRTGEHSTTFENNVYQYLGKYDYDWAKDIEITGNAQWCGYLNSAGDFVNQIDFIFILYDDKKPVYIVNAIYELDNRSHIGDIISIRGWDI